MVLSVPALSGLSCKKQNMCKRSEKQNKWCSQLGSHRSSVSSHVGRHAVVMGSHIGRHLVVKGSHVGRHESSLGSHLGRHG